MAEQIVGVKEFLGIINETLGFAFPAVTVEGEVSGFKIKDKFLFFDLKDGEATMACFMMSFQLKVAVEDGMKVQVSGSPKVTAWGKFSFTVKTLTPSGEGALKRAFELLRARLEQEGLFGQERKRLLPPFPERIGLVTSAGSDAHTDFMDRLAQRWGGVEVLLADVAVQGASAPDQIAAALAGFNQVAKTVDVIVLTRGGGSLEDLQAFNTETVVRAVAASRAPIIVGVGHEANTSLADLAADARAATPTAAAILAVPDRLEVGAGLEQMEGMWVRSLRHLAHRIDSDLDRHLHILSRAMESPKQRLERAESVLDAALSNLAQGWRTRVEALERLITTLSPRAVMSRGYSIARRGSEIIRSSSQAGPGDGIVIELHEGNLRTTVDDA